MSARPVTYDVHYQPGSADWSATAQQRRQGETWYYNGEKTKPVERPVGEFQALVQGELFDDPEAYVDAVKVWRKGQPGPSGKVKTPPAAEISSFGGLAPAWTKNLTKPFPPLRLDKIETEWLGVHVRLFGGPRTGTVWSRTWAVNGLFVLLDPEHREREFEVLSVAIDDLTKIESEQLALV